MTGDCSGRDAGPRWGQHGSGREPRRGTVSQDSVGGVGGGKAPVARRPRRQQEGKEKGREIISPKVKG